MSLDESNSERQVSVYLKGDDLDPQVITSQLGIEPTQCHRKGYKWITSSGKEVTERTGLWVLSARASDDVSSALHEISSKMRMDKIKPLQTLGIEDAFIDVFMASDAEDDGGGTIEFYLDAKSIAAISELELPVQFTIAVVRQ
jgi:hypothetical protein